MQKSHFIYTLFAHKRITKGRFFELKAQEKIEDNRPFFFYLFLTLGITLTLIGLTFFIAANWTVIPKMIKLFGLEALLLLFILLAFYFRVKPIWFHLSLFSASILVGVFLAALGQIYQSGADSYLLFSLWTLLITPWALFLHLPHLFSFWLFLLYLSIFLFWDQYLQPFELISYDHFALILIALSHIFLFASLLKPHYGIFKPIINRYAILILSLLTAAIPVIDEIFSTTHHGNYFYLIFLVQLLALGSFYFNRKQLAPLGFLFLDFLIIIEVLLFKGLIHDVQSLFIFAFMSIILTLLFANIIKQLHKHFSKQSHE